MKLKVNWPYLVFCIITWGAMCGFIGWAVTAQTWGAVQRGVPLPGGWSWTSVIGLDIICVAAFLWFAWKLYCDVNTEITNEYVSQPRLIGSLKIAWPQVQKVTTYGYGIHVHGQGGKIVLTPYAYKNPDEVMAKIGEIVERHSLPTE